MVSALVVSGLAALLAIGVGLMLYNDERQLKRCTNAG